MATYLFITFAVTAILGFPIWAVLTTSCFVALTMGSNTPLIVVVQRMFTATDSFPSLAVPLFMVAGNLMETGGISRRLINFCNSILGWLPGGLGMAAILTCMFFAAISGSGPATVAAIGGIMIPEMEKAGYDKAFAAALMAVSGAIGVIIPPSIPMVNFGVVGSVSIATLFAAGFGPGILGGLALMIVTFITAKKNGYGLAVKQKFSIVNVGKEFIKAFWALLMPVIILGGIYGGIFTPTEAAIIATFYAIFLGFFYRTLTLKKLLAALKEASETTCTVMMIVCGATIFCYILSFERFPQMVANLFLTYVDNKYLALLVINIFLVFVGMFMDSSPSIIILTPVFLPVVTAFGVDPVHFGIIMILNLMIGLLTPPVGMVLYVLSKVSSVPFERICKATVPFIIMFYIILQFITYIPQITLALPTWMYGA